jgi:hypothetical protein
VKTIRNVFPDQHGSDGFSERVWEAIVVEHKPDLPYEAKIRAALTDAEYQSLLAWIKDLTKRKPAHGRPPRADWTSVGSYCLQSEIFMPLKAAVAKTMTAFGVSRALVYTARRKLLSK